MDDNLVSLLPIVIAILRNKPHHSASLDELCDDIDAYPDLSEDMMSHICLFDTTKDALKFAMDLGIDMGILFYFDGILCIPIKLSSNVEPLFEIDKILDSNED